MKRKLAILFITSIVLFSLSGCGIFIKKIPQGEIAIPCPNGKDQMIKIGATNFHYTEYDAPGQDVLMVHGFG